MWFYVFGREAFSCSVRFCNVRVWFHGVHRVVVWCYFRVCGLFVVCCFVAFMLSVYAGGPPELNSPDHTAKAKRSHLWGAAAYSRAK